MLKCINNCIWWVLNIVLAQYNIVLAKYNTKVSLERKSLTIFEQTVFFNANNESF